jgi:hypothetical protein
VADTFQFVDGIAASPTVRLDLNNESPWAVPVDGFDCPPPRLKRAQASTLMRDGAVYPAAAYEDRVLRFVLEMKATSVDNAATAFQTLARELDREENFIRWQVSGATNPVFFRTKRSDVPRITELPGAGTFRVFQMEVLAESAAFGPKEAIATATVSNNPAAANGCFMDLGTIKGDVQTPLIIKTSTTNLVSANENHSLFAMRRGGTPSNAPVALQAEDMTSGTDTTEPGNDGAMSGAGSNYARCSFGTTTAMATRLSLFWQGPGAAASVDHRGTYRVFARIRRSVAGADVVKVRLRWGGTSGVFTNDTVTTTATTNINHIDLGLVQAPPGPDPVTDGLSGTKLSVYGVFLDVQAERASGTSNIDFDYLFLAPADDGLAIVDWGTTSGANFYTLDCTQDITYQTITSGPVHGVNMAGLSGGYRLMASPGVNNRLYFVRQIRQGAPTDTIGGTNDLDVSYYPRYLYLAPT